jgi:hypothetical protein
MYSSAIAVTRAATASLDGFFAGASFFRQAEEDKTRRIAKGTVQRFLVFNFRPFLLRILSRLWIGDGRHVNG